MYYENKRLREATNSNVKKVITHTIPRKALKVICEKILIGDEFRCA